MYAKLFERRRGVQSAYDGGWVVGVVRLQLGGGGGGGCSPLATGGADQGTQVTLDTNSVMCKKRCVVCVCVCVCLCVYVCVCCLFHRVLRWEQTKQSSSAKRWSPTTTTQP